MLCCIGDLVEDVVAWLSSDIAKGTDTDVEIHRRRGGSAANVAVAAAGTGVPVRFIGRVGNDTIGRVLVSELANAGVDAVVQRSGRTGTIIVLVDAVGERSMLPDRAAAIELDHVSKADLDGVDWVHLPAYSLVGGPIAEASLEAIRIMKERGGTVSVDASSVAIIEEFGVQRFGDLLSSVGPGVVLFNRDEANVLEVSDAKGLPGIDLTVVKDGPRAAVALDSSGIVASASAQQLANVRDTTGAGDAFAAGFIVAMMGDYDVEAALANGHAVAASVLTRLSP
ncbi:MAG: carbohydrate kinase family protein [Actinomycetia bacterium]|nr:carbohydrate kinase family protein [Actinomycetes bacterium]